jgi:hypothetical protein
VAWQVCYTGRGLTTLVMDIAYWSCPTANAAQLSQMPGEAAALLLSCMWMQCAVLCLFHRLCPHMLCLTLYDLHTWSCTSCSHPHSCAVHRPPH